MDALARLGWGDDLAAAFISVAEDGDVPARIVAQHRDAYDVASRDGTSAATLAGRLRHFAAPTLEIPAVGDWVAVRASVVRAVVPRRNAVRRRDPFYPRAQVLAANVDDVLVVAPLHRDLDGLATRIARYVALAHDSGARATILLTKADLCPDPRAQLARAERAAPDASVLVTSSVSGEGLGTLARALAAGRTAVLLGPSGAGKSTLVNALTRTDALVTRDVDRTGEGRHASVRRDLVLLPQGGAIIDTPGLRELDAWTDDATVSVAYADIAALAASCRFRDCAHEREPGCAVRAAIDAGQLADARLRAMRRLEREAVRASSDERERAAYRRTQIAEQRRRARAARRSGRGS